MTHNEQRPPSSHFETLPDQALLTTLRSFGKAAYTLFNVPEHDSSLFHDVANALADEPQSIHNPIEDEVAAIRERSFQLIDRDKALPQLKGRELLGHMAVLMQFTSYLPQVRPYAQTPFVHVDKLYEGIVGSDKDMPLGFADQLDIALGQTQGDLPEAMWRLFITSRQHARWFDSSVITDMPDFSRQEKMDRMDGFSRAVAACKPHEKFPIQDTSGDTYYGWTHALGKVAFGLLAANPTILTKTGAGVIHNGTRLMHNFAHRFKSQSLASDHIDASVYGNAIGDTLVQLFRGETEERSDSSPRSQKS